MARLGIAIASLHGRNQHLPSYQKPFYSVEGHLYGHRWARQVPVEIPIKQYWCPSRGDRLAQPDPNGLVYSLTDYASFRQGLGDQNTADTAFTYEGGGGPLGGGKLQATKRWADRGVIRKGGQVTTVGATGSSGPVQWLPWTHLKLKDITDGTSKTAALMEKMCYAGKCYQPDPNGSNYGEVPGWIESTWYATSRYTPNGTDAQAGVSAGMSGNFLLGPSASNQMVPDLNPIHNTYNASTGVPQWCEDYGFFSAHTTVMNAVFADGSVHPISTNIQGLSKSQGGEDNCMLFRLGARDDGLQVDY